MEADNNIETTSAEFSPRAFSAQLEQYQQGLSSITTSEGLHEFILSDFSELLGNFIKLSKAGIRSDQPQYKYAFSYEFPEKLKDYGILHRDVLLEIVKGHVKIRDRVLSQDELETHFQESQTVLLGATADLLAGASQILSTQPTESKIKRSLSLLQSPWDVYEKQLQTIIAQLSLIEDSNQELEDTIAIFEDIQISITATTDAVENEQQRIINSVEELIEQLKAKQPKATLVQLLEKQLSEIPNAIGKQKLFNNEITSKINALPSVSTPIGTLGGLLKIRDENLSEDVHLWMDYRILPFLVDLWALEDRLKFSYKKMLHHVLSHLQAAGSEDIDYQSFIMVAGGVRRKLSEAHPQINRFIKEVDILDDELLVSNLYRDKSFLAVPFQSRSTRGTGKFSKPFQKGYRRFLDFFNFNNQNHNSLTPIELASQCMAHRMRHKSDNHYDALFLNKRFIGDLFLIPRIREEQKLTNAIQQWKEGFSKSVLVTGSRLSGKTTFLTYTSKKYFGKDIVVLTPDSPATIDGRKFKTTKNLKKALDYIRANNARSTQPVIIIDNIELWRDADHSLVSNVRALIDFAETVEGRAFILVSTTPIMKEHLDTRLDFSRVFNTLINVDAVNKEELKEIFFLRHEASHRLLVNEESEAVGKEKIKDFIIRVGRKENYNIGLALQKWTHHIELKDENKIQFKKIDHAFYDFFSKEEIIILKHALLYRKITTLELKQISSLTYEHHFKSAIRHLINTKVLIREGQFLEINTVVLGDILKILKGKGILS